VVRQRHNVSREIVLGLTARQRLAHLRGALSLTLSRSSGTRKLFVVEYARMALERMTVKKWCG
jgi:hypothetical protein